MIKPWEKFPEKYFLNGLAGFLVDSKYIAIADTQECATQIVKKKIDLFGKYWQKKHNHILPLGHRITFMGKRMTLRSYLGLWNDIEPHYVGSDEWVSR